MAEQIAAIQQFLFHEARLLDQRRWDEWLDLFEPGGYYWVPLVPEQTDPINHASLYYEDAMLREVRVRRLREVRAFSQEPHTRSARLVGNVLMGATAADHLVVHSTFHLLESRGDQQRQFGGAYTHQLVAHAGGWRIRLKRVDLINCDAPHEALQLFI